MLQRYSSQKERSRFIDKLEKLLLEGFGRERYKKLVGVTNQQISDFIDKERKKPTIFMRKQEKEDIKKLQKEAEERYMLALGMIIDASELNRRLLADMEANPKEYINLLKRKIFNPHKCNIGNDDFSFSMQSKRNYAQGIQCGDFALLYAFLANWVENKDMTILECYAIYQRFGFICNVIHPSTEQKILMEILNGLVKCEGYKPMMYENVEHLVVKDNKLVANKIPKTFGASNNRHVKLFVEYWDYNMLRPLLTGDNIWNELTLEEIVEQGRQGIGPVKRTEIPWETRRVEKYHTFMGGVYENRNVPAPENIRHSYLKDFKEILKLNVRQPRYEGFKYENGREIGFTVWIDEKNIMVLPFDVDWDKIERCTDEEEAEIRRREEEDRKREMEWKKWERELFSDIEY